MCGGRSLDYFDGVDDYVSLPPIPNARGVRMWSHRRLHEQVRPHKACVRGTFGNSNSSLVLSVSFRMVWTPEDLSAYLRVRSAIKSDGFPERR